MQNEESFLRLIADAAAASLVGSYLTDVTCVILDAWTFEGAPLHKEEQKG